MKLYKTLLLITLFVASSAFGQSEKSNFTTAQFGVGTNYYYGSYKGSFDDFKNNLVNYQLNGMVGFAVNKGDQLKRTYLALFGEMGFINRDGVNTIISDQHYIITGNPGAFPAINNCYLVEAGFQFSETFRVSTGFGTQYFQTRTMQKDGSASTVTTDHLNYNSTTVGVKLGKAKFHWFFNCNALYGKDFSDLVLRPSTGLGYTF